MKSINQFTLFNNDWALVTAGPIEHHNSMTISWGGLGTLWNKSVATIYIKPCRYTYLFMEDNEYFVISFFDDRYKKSLGKMGSISGRDYDKDKESNLSPVSYKGVTIYKEAKITLVCKKIYYNDLSLENIPVEERDRHYKVDKPHRMYIGEVVEIIDK